MFPFVRPFSSENICKSDHHFQRGVSSTSLLPPLLSHEWHFNMIIFTMMSEQRYSVMHRETLRIGRFQATYRCHFCTSCMFKQNQRDSSTSQPVLGSIYLASDTCFRTMNSSHRDFPRSIFDRSNTFHDLSFHTGIPVEHAAS